MEFKSICKNCGNEIFKGSDGVWRHSSSDALGCRGFYAEPMFQGPFPGDIITDKYGQRWIVYSVDTQTNGAITDYTASIRRAL